MNEVILKLHNERAVLVEKLARVDSAIKEYERWAASVADLFSSTPTDGEAHTTAHTPSSSPTDTQEKQPRATSTAASIREFEEVVRVLMEAAEEPVQRGPLLAALTRRGVDVPGKDPANTMSARLSRMDDIINIKGHGYWLKSRKYEPAGYFGGRATRSIEELFGEDQDPKENDSSLEVKPPHTEP